MTQTSQSSILGKVEGFVLSLEAVVEFKVLLVSVVHVFACLSIMVMTFIARPKTGNEANEFTANLYSADSLLTQQEMNRFVVRFMWVVGAIVVATSLLLVRLPDQSGTGGILKQLEQDIIHETD